MDALFEWRKLLFGGAALVILGFVGALMVSNALLRKDLSDSVHKEAVCRMSNALWEEQAAKQNAAVERFRAESEKAVKKSAVILREAEWKASAREKLAERFRAGGSSDGQGSCAEASALFASYREALR